MTEMNLEKAKVNRELRRKALNEYNKISEAINEFSKEGFNYDARIKTWERGDWKDIYPDPEEFHNMLLNMRDRYDAEIDRLDKEFEKL
jgi:hypothetical protein